MADAERETRAPVRRYRYYDLLLAGFVAVLLCSNLIGPAKVAELTLPIAGITLAFGAGNLFFPISYIFGDVLTEVYGYARARRVIWAGVMAMIFATAMAAIIIALPASPAEPFNRSLQPALEIVFGNTWRVVVASIVAFWAGGRGRHDPRDLRCRGLAQEARGRGLLRRSHRLHAVLFA